MAIHTELETLCSLYIHGSAGTGSQDFLPKEMSGKNKKREED